MDFPLEFQDPPGFAPEFSPDRHPGIIRDEDFILLRSITNPEGGIQGMAEHIELEGLASDNACDDRTLMNADMDIPGRIHCIGFVPEEDSTFHGGQNRFMVIGQNP